jgi:hypothetical protein
VLHLLRKRARSKANMSYVQTMWAEIFVINSKKMFVIISISTTLPSARFFPLAQFSYATLSSDNKTSYITGTVKPFNWFFCFTCHRIHTRYIFDKNVRRIYPMEPLLFTLDRNNRPTEKNWVLDLKANGINPRRYIIPLILDF